MKNTRFVYNQKVYSVPTIEKVNVVGGEIITDPDKFVHVLVPEKGYIVISKNNKFFNINMKVLGPDIIEPLFKKHIVK